MGEGLILDLRCQICQPTNEAATEFEALPVPPQFIVPCRFSHFGVSYDNTIVTQRLTDDNLPATSQLFYWFAIDNRYAIEASSLLVFDSPRSHFRVEEFQFAGRYYIVSAEVETSPTFSTTRISTNRLNTFLFPRSVTPSEPGPDMPEPEPMPMPLMATIINSGQNITEGSSLTYTTRLNIEPDTALTITPTLVTTSSSSLVTITPTSRVIATDALDADFTVQYLNDDEYQPPTQITISHIISDGTSAPNATFNLVDREPAPSFSYSFNPSIIDIVEGGTAQTTLTFVGIPVSATETDAAAYDFVFNPDTRSIRRPRGISVTRNNTEFPITLRANEIDGFLPDLTIQLRVIDDSSVSGQFRTFGIANNPTNLTINWSDNDPRPLRYIFSPDQITFTEDDENMAVILTLSPAAQSGYRIFLRSNNRTIIPDTAVQTANSGQTAFTFGVTNTGESGSPIQVRPIIQFNPTPESTVTVDYMGDELRCDFAYPAEPATNASLSVGPVTTVEDQRRFILTLNNYTGSYMLCAERLSSSTGTDSEILLQFFDTSFTTFLGNIDAGSRRLCLNLGTRYSVLVQTNVNAVNRNGVYNVRFSSSTPELSHVMLDVPIVFS